MTVRKRTPQEQTLFDQIEALRVKRRGLMQLKGDHLKILEGTSVREQGLVLQRATNYLEAIARVAEIDHEIGKLNNDYKALRSMN